MLYDWTNKTSSTPLRVVVTGCGLITALGCGWAAHSTGLRQGRRALGPVSLFDASRQRVNRAGEVTLPPELPGTHLSARSAKRADRAAQLLLHAAAEGWQQAQWAADAMVPIVLGTTAGGMTLGEAYHAQAVRAPQHRRMQPTRAQFYQAYNQAVLLTEAFHIHGPITILTNACASGANAIGFAWETLRSGRAERVLCGGYEALSSMLYAGFDSLQLLSPRGCCPFDAHRDGLSLGEGAAILALETLAHAQRRDAEILAEVIGYGAATDPHHLTQPHPEGTCAITTMAEACRQARLSPGEVQYLNAHGTGTVLNDSSEAAAINSWAGAHAPNLAVSSIKGSIGHLLGASGAVEAAACVMMLREQWIAPQTNLDSLDGCCRFQVPRQPTSAPLDHVMSNSFGFGGANASLLFRRWS